MSLKAKLKWHCRRGMRELDLLLEAFLEQMYDALPPAGRNAFERLLDCRNQDLMAWLIEGKPAADAGLAAVVAAIRSSAPRPEAPAPEAPGPKDEAPPP